MALTKDRNTASQKADVITVAVAAGVTIHAGALVVANATGFVAPGTTATGLTYLGRSEGSVDNSAGINGAVDVVILRKRAFKFKNDGTVGDCLTTRKQPPLM